MVLSSESIKFFKRNTHIIYLQPGFNERLSGEWYIFWSIKTTKNIKQQFSLKSLKWEAASRNDVQLGFIYHSLKVEGSTPSSRRKLFTSRNCHKLTRLQNSFWSNYFLVSVSSQEIFSTRSLFSRSKKD